MQQLLNIDARTLISELQNKKIPVTELIDAVLARLADCNKLNSVIQTKPELSRLQAGTLDKLTEQQRENLPLFGLPILVKDNINTQDFLTTGGTAALARHQPTEDAGVISLLKSAGAVIIGKANMHELAFGITSNNAHTAAVRNPYDTNLISGGSSGGSAAAVSAGIVPLALGTDTGGSNRIPASLCGVCGFRPSTGRYPDNGLIKLSKTRDTVGIFARQVSDIALVDNILGGDCQFSPVNLSQLRLAVPGVPFYRVLEKATAEVLENALSQLASSGVSLIEVDMPDLFSLNEKISFPVALYETVRELTDYLQEYDTGLSLDELVGAVLSPDVKQILEAAQHEQKIPEQVYQEAINIYRPQLQQMYADYFAYNNVDAMIYPTTSLTARPVGDDETVELNGASVPTFSSYIRNSDPSSNAGIPSLSIPAGLSTTGLPVGISIDGPRNGDANVLSIGAAIAAILPSINTPAL